MLTTVDHELHDPRRNTQGGIMEQVHLVETEIEVTTGNFDSVYLSPFVPDEKLENVDEDFSQAYFWTEEWQKAESEANEDIRMGRVKTFNSVDDLITELQS